MMHNAEDDWYDDDDIDYDDDDTNDNINSKQHIRNAK